MPLPHSPAPSVLHRLTHPFVAFARMEAAGGIVLMLCAVLALAWANLPGGGYAAFWHQYIKLGFGETWALKLSLGHWINDALMAVFFFQVGLEIKRELLTGELNTPRKAALPIAAALGGMVIPALIYMGFNPPGTPGQSGWGIPMATDIAFSLGVLSLLGTRAPLSLKVFLTALAIVDDLGAVLVIAFFYTEKISGPALGVAALAWAALLLFGRLGGRRWWLFLPLALVLWVAVLKSGVHATIAGVLAAMAVPGGPEKHPPLERWAHALHPWVSFFIMPIFALANAGVAVGGHLAGEITSPVALGIALGLFAGKTAGIFAFSWLTIRLGLAARPSGVSNAQLAGISMLAGIGFTMSMFVAALAFGSGPLSETAKVGIISGSLLSALGGASLLWAAARNGGAARRGPQSP